MTILGNEHADWSIAKLVLKISAQNLVVLCAREAAEIEVL